MIIFKKQKFINNIKSLEQLLLPAIVFSALVIAFVGFRIFMSLNEVSEQLGHNKILANYISDIRYLDEVLTSSARLAANTGDLKWGERYRFFESKLDSAIKKSISLEPSGEAQIRLSMIDSANIKLVVIEHHALDLVAKGDQQEAKQLLSSQEYEREKVYYTNELTMFIRVLNLKNNERNSIIARRANQNYVIFSLAILSLLAIWILLVRAHISSRNELIKKNQLLEEEIKLRKQAEITIQQQNKQLEEINAAKDKFFSMIAHDLKGPFHSFLGLTKILSEDSKSFSAEELSEIGRNMNQSANNLFALLQNLFEWANLQKGTMIFQPEELSLSELISVNVELINHRSLQKGINLTNMATKQFNVYADKNMINSVLSNLLWNAVKFTNRNGTVAIDAKKNDNEMIEVSIKDSGIGMNKSIIDNLFKAGEKTGIKGTEGELSTGLGLLLCKEFVEKNGGEIWVESEEGVGSSFYFTLPESLFPVK